MGRTWKYTEQIYEEISEAIDKKIETRFDLGVMGSGTFGVFGNPFEKYAEEINTGISKMNSYVDMINEAEGFTKTKLFALFCQVMETDNRYGKEIRKCTEGLEHYKNILGQLETVMENAVVSSSNGNAVFTFDREAFQEKIIEDKHAMDIAFVDRILSGDVETITAEEYMQIAVLLGNQNEKDTTLIQHILNSEYLWEFVNESFVNGDGVAQGAEGLPSTGVMMPNEKYILLTAALKDYAYEFVANKPETDVSTRYLSILNNALMYANLLDMADDFWKDNTWNYQIGMEKDMKQIILRDFFTVGYGETSVMTTESEENLENAQGHCGMLVTIKGMFGNAELEILKPFDGSSTITGLSDLEHTYINHYLKLDLSDREYVNNALINQIWSAGESSAMNTAFTNVLQALGVGEAGNTAITTGAGIIIGTAEDVKEHQETKENILKFQEKGDLSSTIHTLELYCNINNYNHTITGGTEATVVVYPTSVTAKRIEMLNRLIEESRIKERENNDIENSQNYLKDTGIEELPDGKFTLDFVVNHIDEVDKMLDIMERNIRNHSSYNSLLQILEAEYAE